MICILA